MRRSCVGGNGGEGVKTRQRMPVTAIGLKDEETSSQMAEKRSREVGDGELEFVELRSTRRRVVIAAVSESFSPADDSACCGQFNSELEINSVSELTSCCSSNASSELVRARSAISDPTTDGAQHAMLTFSGGTERSEVTISSESCAEESGDLESTAAARPVAGANTRHISTVAKMPSESEIEEFFSATEKNLHENFSKKYNFDVVKGFPLEGRYEWVRVSP